jgi:hypothetical protein
MRSYMIGTNLGDDAVFIKLTYVTLTMVPTLRTFRILIPLISQLILTSTKPPAVNHLGYLKNSTAS